MKKCAVVLWLVLAGVLSVLLCAGTLKQEVAALDEAFDSDRYKELLGGALFSEDEVLEEYAFMQDMLLPVMVPSGDEYRHQAGITVINPDKFTKDFLKGLLPRESKAAGIYTYRVTIREQDLPYGGRARVVLNEEGKEIWQVKLPYDYDPWAYLRQTHPEIFGLGGAKAESAYAEFLFMVYNPGRIVVTMDLLSVDDLISYVWAESLEEMLVAETLDGGTVKSMRDGGGITNIAFIGVSQSNGTLTFTLSYPDMFTSALCVVGSTNLVTRDWTLLAETNASSETNQLFITDDASPENYRWFAAYNDNYDGDGDGVVNGEEFFLDHSDPANPHDPPNIYGAVSYQTYSGGQTGTVYALAVASSNSCSTNYGNALPMPDDYHLTKLPAGYYWIRAWRDSDGNRTCGVYEASGYFTNNAVYVTGQVSAADILMTDPDTDSDGLGDWWENQYFGDPDIELDSGDADIDKLMNLYEYYAGTDPTAGFMDDDGDGIANDWEDHYNMDPTDPTDADDDPDQDGFTSLEEYLSGSNGTDPTDPLSHPDTGNYVATNGVDAAGYGSYTNPYATISYAFSQAADGEHVIILPGVHTGSDNRNVSFGGKNLTVTGLQGQESNTVIDCESSGRAFSITSGETNAEIRHLTIINGRYTGTAGAINVGNAHLTLLACNLTSNTAVGGMAGALLVNGGSVLVEESTFTGNSASGNGGAIYINGQTSRVSWCSFTDNSGMNGSAISASSELTIDHCMICSNACSYYGGALYSEDRLIVENSLLKENINGAIASEILFYGSYMTLQNCTLVGCANPYSASLVNHASHYVGITNCIIQAYGNNAISGSSFNRVVAYSCVPGVDTAPGLYNISVDPGFCSDGWRLRYDSPCVDSGTNCLGYESETDLEGVPRISNNAVDMGADEVKICFVDAGCSNPVSPYNAWSTAATNIQDAIQIVEPYEIVLVTNGIYTQGDYLVGDGIASRVALTNECIVLSVNGASLTTIQGHGPDGASAVRCAYVGSNCILGGFTLVSGHTDTAGGSLSQDGGGVWGETCGEVVNCIISNCSARNGGGVYGGEVKDCLVVGNAADCGGGACSSLVVSCVMSNNSATYGAGLYNSEAHCSLLQHNEATSDGGGAHGGLLRSCLVVSNTADCGGGTYESTVENCTVCDNYATDGGGSWGGSLLNSIVYFNSSSNWSGGTFTNCCTIPDPGGVHCITNDPRFVSRTNGDYCISAASGCCDAGFFVSWMAEAFDYDANLRRIGTMPDLGAYENTECVTEAFVQILDKSTSMANYSIAAAKKELMFMVDGMNTNDLLGIVAFDTESTEVRPLVSLSGEEAKDSVKNAISRIEPEGGTLIDAGLDEAVNQYEALDSSYSKEIFIWTDAGFSSTTNDYLRHVPLDVRINGVMARNSSNWDNYYLSWLAQRRRGLFFDYPQRHMFMGLTGTSCLLSEEAEANSSVTNEHILRVDSGCRSVDLRLMINSPDISSLSFWAKRPDGTYLSASDPNVSYSEYDGGGVYHMNLPSTGIWTMYVSKAIGSMEYCITAQGFGLGNTRFAMDKIQHTTNCYVNVLLLTAKEATNVAVRVIESESELFVSNLALRDDGNHGDGDAGDGLFGGQFAYSTTEEDQDLTLNADVQGIWSDGCEFERKAEQSLYFCSKIPLNIPTSCAATTNLNGCIEVSWTRESIHRYEIQRSEYSNKWHDAKLVGSIYASSVVDTNVLRGTRYYYRVRAFQKDHIDSEFSEVLTGIAQ